MAAANGVPVLWQFTGSHFNEKVRWALDWKGVRHERRSLLPGVHIPVVLWLTGQKQVPVLRLGNETIADSTRIIAALERRFPEPPLYPTDPAARARALELEEHFDDEIGPHVRRCVFHAALHDTDFVTGLFTQDAGTIRRAFYRLAFPAIRAAMRLDMGITDAGAARSLALLEAAFDRLEREVGPSGHLVGDGFTVADLTAASLLVPLTVPPEFPYPLPVPPPRLRELQDRFVKRPGFAWARETYRRYRGGPAARDVTAPAAS
jgi:glutathione S-transferase